jgi:Ca2+:H+ antiporter
MRSGTATGPLPAGAPSDADLPKGLRDALLGLFGQPFYWLLLALPLVAGLRFFSAGAVWVFLTSAIAIVPLAGLMGRATESLAASLGAGIGGLLNATLGNAAELILALFALWHGPEMYPLVKASLTGSILGNILLVMGASIVAGGLFFPKQQFNRTAAGMGVTLLALASIGLIMPALSYYLLRVRLGQDTEVSTRVESLSEEIAGILAVIYLLSLVFTLVTHRDLFSGRQEETPAGCAEKSEWSRSAALTVLAAATAGVAWMSETLVGTVEQARHALGLGEVFVGVVVVAVIGNAAEHSSAVLMAMKNKMDIVVQIAVGSGIQVALFVAPVLVFASMAMGHAHPLDLHFTLLETVAVVLAVGVLALVCQDGETHWMEGAMMLGVYAIMALAFYHLPD